MPQLRFQRSAVVPSSTVSMSEDERLVVAQSIVHMHEEAQVVPALVVAVQMCNLWIST